MIALSASVRHRMTRRGVVPRVWLQLPTLSPYVDRLKQAAIGDHVCGHQLFIVPTERNIR